MHGHERLQLSTPEQGLQGAQRHHSPLHITAVQKHEDLAQLAGWVPSSCCVLFVVHALTDRRAADAVCKWCNTLRVLLSTVAAGQSYLVPCIASSQAARLYDHDPANGVARHLGWSWALLGWGTDVWCLALQSVRLPYRMVMPQHPVQQLADWPRNDPHSIA